MTDFASWRWEDALGLSLPARDDEAIRRGTVAVLDTGLSTAHPALRGARVTAARSFVDEDPLDDRAAHGSACAGALVADGGHGGPEGLLAGARLLVGQVISSAEEGSVASLCAGLRWAMDLGASVIALPSGLLYPDDALDAVVAELVARGVVLVAAAGNPYAGQRGPMFPAACEGVLCAGAQAYAEQYATWSRRPDLVLPAHDIPVVDGDARWKLIGGTSIATMIAAGVLCRGVRGAWMTARPPPR